MVWSEGQVRTRRRGLTRVRIPSHARRAWQYVRALSLRPVWRRISLSSLVVGFVVLFVLAQSALVRNVETVDPARIQLRPLGNRVEAVDRIRRENFTTVERLDQLAANPNIPRYERMVYAHAPLMLEQPRMLSTDDDIPIGVYYTLRASTFQSTEVVTIAYYIYFTDEASGMPVRERMARYGHPMDREMIYRISYLNDKVLAAYYQAPIHKLERFTYPDEGRPVFRLASLNNNFGLVRQPQSPVMAPLPLFEPNHLPFRDPDFMALAGREALLQHGVDISRYVYVGITNPSYVGRDPYPGIVDVAIRVRDQWYYLHDVVGSGVYIDGYRLVGVSVGFTPRPDEVDEIRVITRGARGQKLLIVEVYTLPRLNIVV